MDRDEDSIASMIAKVELSAEIAQIALACHNCNRPVNNAINRFKNRNRNQNQNKNVNPVRGHSSLEATNESMDGNTTEVSSEVFSNDSSRQQYK